MQALKLEAISGWRWVVAGMKLFRAQPFSLVALLFLSGLLLISASAAVEWIAAAVGTTLPSGTADFVEWIGGIVIALFSPALTVGFQQGCRVAANGLPVHPALLFAPFRAGRTTLTRLLVLGAVQVAALACIVWAATGTDALRQEPASVTATAASNGKAASPAATDAGKAATPPTEAEQKAMVRSAVQRIKLGLACAPVALLLWYAPMLVAWHGVTPGKALFFSLVAVWRNRSAFAVYALAWLVLSLLAAIILGTVMIGLGRFGAIVAAPAVMLLSTCMYCSVYPTYATVFVDPAAPAVPPS